MFLCTLLRSRIEKHLTSKTVFWKCAAVALCIKGRSSTSHRPDGQNYIAASLNDRKGFLHERTHHKTRPPIQRARRSGHVMGVDASRTRNSRAVLALNSTNRWSSSCDTAPGRVARRCSSLQYCLHLTEGRESAWKSARDSDDWLQPVD